MERRVVGVGIRRQVRSRVDNLLALDLRNEPERIVRARRLSRSRKPDHDVSRPRHPGNPIRVNARNHRVNRLRRGPGVDEVVRIQDEPEPDVAGREVNPLVIDPNLIDRLDRSLAENEHDVQVNARRLDERNACADPLRTVDDGDRAEGAVDRKRPHRSGAPEVRVKRSRKNARRRPARRCRDGKSASTDEARVVVVVSNDYVGATVVVVVRVRGRTVVASRMVAVAVAASVSEAIATVRTDRSVAAAAPAKPIVPAASVRQRTSFTLTGHTV